MQIKLKKLHTNAVIPTYAKPGDAGMDLTAVEINETSDYVEYKTGLAIEVPEGFFGALVPRSSNSKKDLLLCNSFGVLDSSYRGEICFRYKKVANCSEFGQGLALKLYDKGDRVGQLIILPYPIIEFVEVDELNKTERGSGGFGHSGF